MVPGDQGMMFGFACKETSEFMPIPFSLAHKLAIKLSQVRKSRELEYLRPDGKTQVTVEYIDGVPTRVVTVIISTQHSDSVGISQLHKDIISKVIFPIVSVNMIDEDTKINIKL
jgi:S-adenosylmethionine synthetase